MAGNTDEYLVIQLDSPEEQQAQQSQQSKEQQAPAAPVAQPAPAAVTAAPIPAAPIPSLQPTAVLPPAQAPSPAPAATLAVDPADEKTDPTLLTPKARVEQARAAPAAPTRPVAVPPPRAVIEPKFPPMQTQSIQRPSGTDPTLTRTIFRMPDLGALEPLMKDPEITEIMVNDLRNVVVEKNGKLMISSFSYQGIDELNRLVRLITDATGRVLSPDSPCIDTMLPDGSRVNIVGPPLTTGGPCITIRKFPAKPLTIEDLISTDMMDKRIAHFLSVCVLGRMNILISGGTGSGKTTLLNSLLSFIPKGERLVTIEDTPELSISHINSVRLQSKLPSALAPGISARELLAHALRMRPDRVVIGECRRAEAFDMLQAMNTGHDGSMTTLHSNSPRDSISRLETLCMMAGVEMPVLAVRKQIVSAIDLIVQVKRFRNGKRRVIAVTEIIGMEAETVTLQDIFTFDQDIRLGTGAGHYKCTGFVPTFLDKLKENGIDLPRNYFS